MMDCESSSRIPRLAKRDSISHKNCNEIEVDDSCLVPTETLVEIQCEGLRKLVSKQEEELSDLRLFSSIEKNTYEEQVNELKKKNDNLLLAVAEIERQKLQLMKEKENIDMELNRLNNVRQQEKKVIPIVFDYITFFFQFNTYVFLSCLQMFGAKESEIQRAQSNIKTLKSIILKDLTFEKPDGKRLLAEVTRELSIVDMSSL